MLLSIIIENNVINLIIENKSYLNKLLSKINKLLSQDKFYKLYQQVSLTGNYWNNNLAP